jgi:hypothetical protein
MEALTNTVSAASRAIFGDGSNKSTEEPVSGQMGSGTANKPYDKGNLEGISPISLRFSPYYHRGNSTLSGQDRHSPRSSRRSLTIVLVENQPSTTTDTTSTDTKPSSNLSAPKSDLPTTEDTPPPPKPTTSSEERVNATSGGLSEAQTSAPGDSALPDPSSAQKPEQKHQGADRPEESPPTSSEEDLPSSPGADAVKETIAEVEELDKQEFKKDSSDHSGEPLGTVKRDGSESKYGEQPAHEPEKKATGMEYVKSSGFAADGGNFDAAAPGAGREADRKCPVMLVIEVIGWGG